MTKPTDPEDQDPPPVFEPHPVHPAASPPGIVTDEIIYRGTNDDAATIAPFTQADAFALLWQNTIGAAADVDGCAWLRAEWLRSG